MPINSDPATSIVLNYVDTAVFLKSNQTSNRNISMIVWVGREGQDIPYYVM